MDRKHSKLLEMSEAIYAEPDMTKKVKFDRGEMKERIVDIYVSVDTLRDGETSTKREETEDTAPNNGPGDQHSVHVQWWKRPSGVAAVCLGLLCVLLLAGIIGLSVQYRIVSNNSSVERDQLQNSYNTITKERDQLQTSANNLTKERDQLQTERDVLSGWLNNCSWQKFESSWYFLSTETRTWEESRQDCLKRGADLVITNSDKEQTFLFNLKKRVWIGLTDSDNEGTWKWVDGTPLTTGYWYGPQPDNGGGQPKNGEEDCVEIRTDQSPLKPWNDLSCAENLHWICEKVV
ncbi:C-type lectin domain family 4 member E-like isoform X1 [Oncorhynchus nerka]|uniref:C-type lectin domain family 4 member E-like isoform X1 n=1 Tax=Oncorhynchus nerka TaxID=8023 RepID=UPI0031B88B57